MTTTFEVPDLLTLASLAVTAATFRRADGEIPERVVFELPRVHDGVAGGQPIIQHYAWANGQPSAGYSILRGRDGWAF